MVSGSGITGQENAAASSVPNRYHDAPANLNMVSAIFAIVRAPDTMKNTIDDVGGIVVESKFI
jgi:hypothetical protein